MSRKRSKSFATEIIALPVVIVDGETYLLNSLGERVAKVDPQVIAGIAGILSLKAAEAVQLRAVASQESARLAALERKKLHGVTNDWQRKISAVIAGMNRRSFPVPSRRRAYGNRSAKNWNDCIKAASHSLINKAARNDEWKRKCHNAAKNLNRRYEDN